MCDLFEVGLSQPVELGDPGRGQGDPHNASADWVGIALDQSVPRGTVYQPTSAVVPQDEVVGELADRRPGGIWVASDREQQLVLGAREADPLGLLLAPAQKAPQSRAQLEQMLEI